MIADGACFNADILFFNLFNQTRVLDYTEPMADTLASKKNGIVYLTVGWLYAFACVESKHEIWVLLFCSKEQIQKVIKRFISFFFTYKIESCNELIAFLSFTNIKHGLTVVSTKKFETAYNDFDSSSWETYFQFFLNSRENL